jgi:hypothetical protein
MARKELCHIVACIDKPAAAADTAAFSARK